MVKIITLGKAFTFLGIFLIVSNMFLSFTGNAVSTKETNETSNNIFILGIVILIIGLIIIVHSDYIRKAKQSVPEGEFRVGIGLRYKNYTFFAYQGRDVVTPMSRAEHKIDGRCHVTIKGPDIPGGELRVDVDTLQEVDEKYIERGLRKFIKANRKEIKRRTELIFNKGSLDDKVSKVG